jgi:hypothetical protein
MKRLVLLAIASGLLSTGTAEQAFAGSRQPLCVSQTRAGCFTTIQGAVSAAVDGDTINVDPGVFVENVVIARPAKRRKNFGLTISGAGSGLTFVDGNQVGFVISAYKSTAVSLSNMTIRNGGDGGVLGDGSRLQIFDCVITNNPGGGIEVGPGQLALVSSQVTSNNATVDNGRGGIWFSGAGSSGPQFHNDAMFIDRSTIAGNSGFAAGGIFFEGTTGRITNSTISGNTALVPDFLAAQGGGISVERGAMQIANSTISGNVAQSGGGFETISQGGGIFGVSRIELNNVTIALNSAFEGGGVSYSSGQPGNSLLIVSNTIIAGNSATTDPDCNGPVRSTGYNLIENLTAGCRILGTLTGNQTGVDPLLGPLQSNAPATTETMALLAGSPAIGGGSPGRNQSIGRGPSCFPTDQRGVTRPRGGCDIGAYQSSSF